MPFRQTKNIEKGNDIMLSGNASNLFVFMAHEKNTNGKENFAHMDFLGIKAFSPISLNEVDNAIEELYSKGMIDIANR